MTRVRLIDHLLQVSRHRLSAILFLIVLPFLFFWRETLGLRVLADQDAVFWFFPAYQQVAQQLRSFQLPLWNQTVFSGMPLFAAWQAGVLDPLNWLYVALGVSSKTLTLVQELSFVIAGLSTLAYARSIGLSRRGSMIAAVIYAFGGYPVARTLYPGLLHVTALAPLVLFFIERCFQEAGTRRGWRMSVLGGLVVSWQVFAAHPQPFLYSSLLAVAYAVSRVFAIPSERAVRKTFLGQCAVIFVGGACLAGVQILPAIEFASESVRRSWGYEMFTLHSLHPLSLAGAVMPYLHGGGRGIFHLPYWGPYWHHNEAQIYLGALALSLAAAGAVGAWRARHRVGIFWSCAVVAGVLLALGKYSGPVAWLLYRVPVVNNFRSPNRYWMVVALGVALLAGYAVDRFLRGAELALSRTAVVTSGCLMILVCSVAAIVAFWRGRAESLIRSLTDLDSLPTGFLERADAEVWVPVAAVAISALMILVFTRSRRVGRYYWVLLALLILDFNLYAAFAPIGSSQRLEDKLGTAMPLSLAASSQVEPHRVHLVINPASGEFSPLLFFGHEMASGYDPLLNARYKRFAGIDEAGRSHLSSLLARDDRTLDLLNVRYVMVAPGIASPAVSEATLEGGYRTQLDDSRRWRKLETRSPIDEYRDYTIFENINVLPRAWLVRGFRVLDDEGQLKVIRGEEAGFNPEEIALIAPDQATGLAELPAVSSLSDSVGTVTITERVAGTIVVDVETDQAAMLVLSEISGPGWKARVDGRDEGIRRVNYLLRGLEVPAGRHRVQVWYEPASLKVGSGLTLVSALLMVGLLIVRRRVGR